MLALTHFLSITLLASSWWWPGTFEDVTKQDVINIATQIGFSAKEVTSTDPRVKISASGVEFVSYLDDCRMRSGNFMDQCSKVKFQACWYLSEFGFSSVSNATTFANEYNRSTNPVRKFDTAYSFILPDGRVVCLMNAFYLNDGVSSQYIGASMRGFVRAAEEFKVFAHNWR